MVCVARRFFVALCAAALVFGVVPPERGVFARSGDTDAAALRYSVTLDSLSAGVLVVSLALTGLRVDSLVIRGVPAYMDNPVGMAEGVAVRDFKAWDEGGVPLAVGFSTDGRGEPVFSLQNGGARVEVRYELRVRFVDSPMTERYGVLIPFMDEERAWLCGNYVFCYPDLGPDRRATIRRPVDILLEFQTPDDVALVGLPEKAIELRNIYELMSLQFGLGSFDTESVSPYTIIYLDSLEFDAHERAALRAATARTVSATEEFFGTIPFDHFGFLYFRRNGIGGLEGSNVCQAYLPRAVDVCDTTDTSTRVFHRTVLHEFIHTWNPIYTFAAHDPWIKEGLSCYYDCVLGFRLGYAGADELDDQVRRYEAFFNARPPGELALTDPRLWEQEYDGEEWRLQTYVRGQAAALLLDVLIREQTGNGKSLDDVVRALCRDFRRATYTHGDLLGLIESETGVDAGPFFARYIDGVEVPSPGDVADAVARARELGVFAQ